ncbi:hypothetical protein HPB48_003767 [Haemaphysalis longicornis]|uniref:C2H2-type domain-containing protein n=1 Tax=Haemaphysalis longicornis TaxID=44386 RepID=A0A9J6FHA6_HAELO|nr:hypothetical protein HPB48_003767 [Haemaphysalis longicornis]
MQRAAQTSFRGRLHDDRLKECRTCRRLERQRSRKSGCTAADRENSAAEPRQVVCPLCQASLADSYALLIHGRLHQDIRPFTCSRCAREFPSIAGLLLHRHEHCGEPWYSCVQCHRHFADIALYARHARRHICVWKRARLQLLTLYFWRKRA